MSEDYAKESPDVKRYPAAPVRAEVATIAEFLSACGDEKDQKETERIEGIRGRSKERSARKAKDQRQN